MCNLSINMADLYTVAEREGKGYDDEKERDGRQNHRSKPEHRCVYREGGNLKTDAYTGRGMAKEGA